MQRHRHSGFSLLEVMAVIFVIGLSLGMVSVVVNRGGPKDDVWDAVEKFMGLADFASERAILSGETMGLLMEPPLWQAQAQRGLNPDDIGWRYRWVTSSSEGWMVLPNLPPVTLPPTMKLVVEVDDAVWDYEGQVDRTIPVAAYYPSGDVTPIRIQFSDTREPGFFQHIEVNEEGELVWLEAPEPPKGDDSGF